jgi:hypothetical protein
VTIFAASGSFFIKISQILVSRAFREEQFLQCDVPPLSAKRSAMIVEDEAAGEMSDERGCPHFHTTAAPHGMTASTGPNISSRAMRIVLSTSRKINSSRHPRAVPLPWRRLSCGRHD